MKKLATPQQKAKMLELGIEFDETTTIEEAREMIIDEIGHPEVRAKNTIQDRPELIDSIMTRSEITTPKYNDTNVRFL